MSGLLLQEKLTCLRQLQRNLKGDAYIANEIEVRLLEHAPNAELPHKCLDMLRDCTPEIMISEIFPYPTAAFDGVIAHLVPFWQTDLPTFFNEIRRILSPQGIFLFSTFGKKALHELEILGDALLKAGFQLPVVDRENLQFQYDDLKVLNRDLELTGLPDEIIQISTNTEEDIVLSCEVIYGYALGKKISTAPLGKIEIPVASINLREIK